MKAIYGLTAATVVVLAGCGGSSAGDVAVGSGTVHPAASASSASSSAAPAAEPVTAAAAKSAAETYFALYGAGQYAAVYPMIAPAARKDIRKSVWISLHNKCRNPASAGLTYAVKHPVLAGDTAVVSVGYAGAAASLGSEQITFTYTAGKWYYQPSDVHVYAHHNLAQAIAAAKADGFC